MSGWNKVDELSGRACFVDFMTKEDCYNTFESYGIICVGCGCCSEKPLSRAKARLALHERLLDHDNHFDLWDDDPELRALQQKNLETNIAWNTEKISVYKAIISELEGDGDNG